jgi:pSer/pThr/pTyr-binding forkhead associated (FHA) protein
LNANTISTGVILTATQGDLTGQSFKFNSPNLITIGRHPFCDIQLSDRTVSRYHCFLKINNTEIKIKDLNSKNGTYLNGEKLKYLGSPQISLTNIVRENDGYAIANRDRIKVAKNILEVGIVNLENNKSHLSFDDEDSIISERGIDYTKLRNYLRTQQWDKANRQTAIILDRIFLDICNLEKCHSLEIIDIIQNIDNLYKNDLKILDSLWNKYSWGRFGFSVQKNIFYNLNLNLVNLFLFQNSIDRNLVTFYQKLGWKNFSIFDLLAPRGHLPRPHNFPLQAYCALLLKL